MANKYLQIGTAASGEKETVRQDHKWWHEIDRQVEEERARVYVPDLCIAEPFKVLAKKYYQDKAFKTSAAFKAARDRLSKDVSMSHKELQAQTHYISYHDVPAFRDIIVVIGRFCGLFMRHNCNVGVIDLIIVSTAKYLMDFHGAKRSQLHIITHDKALWRGTKKVVEFPNAYNPIEKDDAFENVFKA